jgi:hypothetical protein
VEPASEVQVSSGGSPLVEGILGEEHPHVAVKRGLIPCHVQAGDADSPRCGPRLPDENLNDGRFPTFGRAHHADDLASFHLKRGDGNGCIVSDDLL